MYPARFLSISRYQKGENAMNKKLKHKTLSRIGGIGHSKKSTIMKTLSIVIPVYNEEESLDELTKEIGTSLETLDTITDYEIIFINDGSIDRSFAKLLELKKKNDKVKIIHLRNNCGKTNALSKGFEHANGDYLITMDADLQDDPVEIGRFIAKLEEGYDLVSGWKQKRKDSLIRVWGSRLFNSVISILSGVKLRDFNCGFKIYRKELYKQLSLHGEQHRLIPMIAKKMGFCVGEIPVHHRKRKYGESKYPAMRVKALFDAISTYFLYSHRNSPFQIFGLLSFALFGFNGILFLCIHFFSLRNNQIPNWNQIILTVLAIFFVVEIPLLINCMGLITELIVNKAAENKPEKSIITECIVRDIPE